MAELFNKSRSTINEHILNIYKEKELVKEETLRKVGNSDFSTDIYGKGVLRDAGKISHNEAMDKAEKEYRKYQLKILSPVEKDSTCRNFRQVRLEACSKLSQRKVTNHE
jgi:hypothetical protein